MRSWPEALLIGLIVALLTGCAPGLRASAWRDYQAYLEEPHFKAFVAADPQGPWDNPNGAVSGRPSVAEAIRWADSLCRQGSRNDPDRPCRIIALGNRSLVGASDEELKEAIAEYSNNPEAFD